MKFRKYSSEDFDFVKSFVDKCNNKDFSVQFLDQGTSILVFDEQDEMIALAMQWRNELHNRTIVIEICVLPERIRKEIGIKSFEKLNEEFPPRENDFAFDIKCENSDIETQELARGLGFERYLDCYNNVFKIDEMTFIDNELDELEFLKLSDFYHDVENKDKVKIFHCSMYDKDHEPFLPLNKDMDVRFNYYNDGDTEYGSLAFLNFENKLKEDVEDVTWLHGYAKGKDIDEEAQLIQALYSYQMKLLKDQGRKNIYIEFDSIEKTSDLMLDWLPYTKKPLLRFQKRV